MSRVQENRMLRKELEVYGLEKMNGGTDKENIINTYTTMAGAILEDISASLAVIADALDKEKGGEK